MEKQIYDKKNGLWYELSGNYYLPCLALPEEEQRSIGVWGRRYLRYIKQYREVFYSNLLIGGKLGRYLADLNKEAKEMFFRLVKQLSDRDGITERLKSENQMEWIRRKTVCREQVRQIVNEELIY